MFITDLERLLLKEKRLKRIKQLTTMIPGNVVVLSVEKHNIPTESHEVLEGMKVHLNASMLHVIFSERYVDPMGQVCFFIITNDNKEAVDELVKINDKSNLGGLVTIELYQGAKEVLNIPSGITINCLGVGSSVEDRV